MGMILEKRGIYGCVVYDHLEKIYYFRTEDNQNLQRIRLQASWTRFTRGKLDMVEKLPFFHDAASAVELKCGCEKVKW